MNDLKDGGAADTDDLFSKYSGSGTFGLKSISSKSSGKSKKNTILVN